MPKNTPHHPPFLKFFAIHFEGKHQIIYKNCMMALIVKQKLYLNQNLGSSCKLKSQLTNKISMPIFEIDSSKTLRQFKTVVFNFVYFRNGIAKNAKFKLSLKG